MRPQRERAKSQGSTPQATRSRRRHSRGVELNLRLELAGEPDQIRGALIGNDGSRAEFTGWLGLATTLGRLLAEEPPPPVDPENLDV